MLAYSDTGSGPTFVFLHGLGLNKNVWSSTITNLSSARCIAIDLPGHGESRAQICDGRMSSYAAAVREIIDKKDLRNVTLVGHSMGGQIGIILALQMPAVISNLALVCAAGLEVFTQEEADKLKAATASVYSNPISDDTLHKTFFHINPEIKGVLQQEHIQQQASNFPQLAKLVTSSVEGMLNEPVSQFLPKIEQPTLVVNGALDVAIPNRWLHPNMNINDVQNASRAIPKSEQVIIPLAGHYLPVDQPQELSTRLNLFRNKS